MITDQLVIVRGSGAAASGILKSMRRAGFPVLVLAGEETEQDTGFLARALLEGEAEEDGVHIALAENLDQAQYLLFEECTALMRDPEGAAIRAIIDTEEKYSEWDTGLTTLEGGGRHVFLLAVADARPAGKTAGTHKGLAPFVIGVGEGFTPDEDCDAVLLPDPEQDPRDIGNAAVVEVVGFAARKAVDETD
jgi:xanthine dehydrogenase accessory factor